MSDDRIIDFNQLKNKVKDSDVDKFEQYKNQTKKSFRENERLFLLYFSR